MLRASTVLLLLLLPAGWYRTSAADKHGYQLPASYHPLRGTYECQYLRGCLERPLLLLPLLQRLLLLILPMALPIPELPTNLRPLEHSAPTMLLLLLLLPLLQILLLLLILPIAQPIPYLPTYLHPAEHSTNLCCYFRCS